jgi:fumarylpyruvate hydrolase
MRIPPFNAYLGTELVRREVGLVEVALELGPHHLNNRGVAHGGVVSALLDSALGAAVVSAIPAEWWCATTSLALQFLDGAGEGRLVAVGRVVRRGRSVAFATGEVHDARGRLIATASGSWHLWPFKPGSSVRHDGLDASVVVRGTGERLRVGKILAVGRNYGEHVAEMGGTDTTPVLFFKPPTALVHDGATVTLPRDAGEVHHEVELVAVIGARGRAIAPEAAVQHVRGFAVGIDLTLRDLQREAKRRGEPWDVAKGFDGSAPVSVVAPAAEVGDGSGLAITLRVNGQTRQSATTSAMIHGVADLVSIASRYITLEPGDLLFTGTPAGVGPVRPGDVIQAEIERVGALQVTFA